MPYMSKETRGGGPHAYAPVEPWPDHEWSSNCPEHPGGHTAEHLRHRVLPAPDQSRYGPPGTTDAPRYDTAGNRIREREN